MSKRSKKSDKSRLSPNKDLMREILRSCKVLRSKRGGYSNKIHYQILRRFLVRRKMNMGIKEMGKDLEAVRRILLKKDQIKKIRISQVIDSFLEE